MRSFLIPVIATCLCATISVAAEPLFGGGAGGRTCADFAKAYKAQPEIMESIFFGWAQGFMTGWNVRADERLHQVDLAVWSVDAQRAHIRNYCDAHPLKNYMDAVGDLLLSMKKDDIRVHEMEAIVGQ